MKNSITPAMRAKTGNPKHPSPCLACLASSTWAQVLHEESDQLRDQTGEEPGDRFVKKDTKFHQVEGAAPLSAPPENEPRKRPPS